jgi:hypothetical protein
VLASSFPSASRLLLSPLYAAMRYLWWGKKSKVVSGGHAQVVCCGDDEKDSMQDQQDCWWLACKRVLDVWVAWSLLGECTMLTGQCHMLPCTRLKAPACTALGVES